MGWDSRRGSVPSERSPLTASKAKASPSSGATIATNVATVRIEMSGEPNQNSARKTAREPLACGATERIWSAAK